MTPSTRSDRGDLLKDTEDTFYGGGQAQPQATPTPTPSPKPAMLNGSQNAASRVNQPSFIGQNGNTISPMYDQQGNVNALPRGAAGVQGSKGVNAFNQSLNGYGIQAPFNLSLNPNPLDINNLIYPPTPVQQARPVQPTQPSYPLGKGPTFGGGPSSGFQLYYKGTNIPSGTTGTDEYGNALFPIG